MNGACDAFGDDPIEKLVRWPVGQDFQLIIRAPIAWGTWPSSTQAWILFGDTDTLRSDAIVDGRELRWREESDGPLAGVVKAGHRYRLYVTMPNLDAGSVDNWFWFTGEVRRVTGKE